MGNHDDLSEIEAHLGEIDDAYHLYYDIQEAAMATPIMKLSQLLPLMRVFLLGQRNSYMYAGQYMFR